MRRVMSHLRGNVVGYVAIFIALSSTAYAIDGSLPGQDTVGSADIINDEVTAGDVRDDTAVGGGLVSRDLRPGSVGTSEVRDDNLRSEDILDGQIRAIDVAFATLRGDEILDGTIGGNDLGDDSVTGDDVAEPTLFNDNSLTTADLADGSVGKGELGPNAVGATELGDALVDRPDATPTPISGGAAHNGAYNVSQGSAQCAPGEEIVGGYGMWTDVPAANAELFIGGVRIDHANESVTVAGGNDSGDTSNLVAVATCLMP